MLNKENHQIEFKESWRDEYLKWLCGFANAQGGVLFIGVNDNGEFVGIHDSKKLMEDLPNKIRDKLGILADIQLLVTENQEYIKIEIEAYPHHTISCDGKYYRRVGATNQQLQGNELTQFLLQRTQTAWDSLPVPQIQADDLSPHALNLFRQKVMQRGRIADDINQLNTEDLLEKLSLYTLNQQLNRTAILMFYEQPEKFITGAYIQIAQFDVQGEILFQDEIHGSIMVQIEQTLNLLLSKYLHYHISFHGTAPRRETLRLPEIALRESLFNAIAHKDYTEPSPIQISVYPHKMVFWNAGSLPENWSAETLWHKHPSKRVNPNLAQMMFWTGDIERWGSGYERIARSLAQAQLPKPKIELLSGLQITYYFDVEAYLREQNCTEQQAKIVAFAWQHGSVSNQQVQEILGVSKATATRLLNSLTDFLDKEGDKGRNVHYIYKGNKENG